MMSEMDVFNATRDYLRKIGALTLQLVPPGGQAPYSITFQDGTRRRTCFPDLLAVVNDRLFVGEMKPRYSKADHDKVTAMTTLGHECLIQLCSRLVRGRADIRSVAGLLCHADISPRSGLRMEQWVFRDHKHVETIPAV